MQERWLPLSKRTQLEGAVEYDALYEGVPSWLRASLFLWIKEHFHSFDEMGDEFWDTERLLEVQRIFRLDLDWDKSRGGRTKQAYFQVQELMKESPELMLDIVDYLLHGYSHGYNDDQMTVFDGTLYQAGSAWRVGRTDDERGCLERRVDEAVTTMARSVMAGSGKAGTHLTLSWNEIFGRDPDPGKGYLEAVKAVEAAAHPVISPKDSKATLGKMIAAMNDAPSKWSATLTSDQVDGVETVINMMKLLWTCQYDRHGSADEESPISVSQEESEAAVHLATVLVQWFESGVIKTSDVDE